MNIDIYNVLVGFRVHGEDDSTAVILCHGRVSFGLTIAEARELSLALARAADDAELKLKD